MRRSALRPAAATVQESLDRVIVQYEAVLDQIPGGFLIAEAPSGRIVRGSRQVEELLRHPVLPSETVAHYTEWVAHHANGEPVRPEEWPLSRALLGETVQAMDVLYHCGDGVDRWIRISGAPIRNERGEVVAGAVTFFDIDREKRVERELAIARDRAEQASQSKSNFLATMSHELRTPLNAIVGYTELLEVEITGALNEAQHAYLSRIQRSGRHLVTLVNDILDMSKIEAGQTTVNPKAVRASEALARAVQVVHPQALARALTINVACLSEEDVAFRADPDRLQQILVNLLSNAVKFTEPGGQITLTCMESDAPAPGAKVQGPGPWVIVRVEDTGIGIPADRLEAIWQPFEQAHSTYVCGGGTGLGLPISRRLAHLMGGDITVSSQVDSGSKFRLSLPAAPLSEVEEAPVFVERRSRSRYTPGIANVADAAMVEIERIVTGYAARLRYDPEVPSAQGMSEAELEDHSATLLADISESLHLIDEAAGAPSPLLRDGKAIQRTIAERHGVQRARSGWSEREVRREYQILREELERAVRRRAERLPETARRQEDAGIEQGLALFAHFIEQAEETSLIALRAEG